MQERALAQGPPERGTCELLPVRFQVPAPSQKHNPPAEAALPGSTPDPTTRHRSGSTARSKCSPPTPLRASKEEEKKCAITGRRGLRKVKLRGAASRAADF